MNLAGAALGYAHWTQRDPEVFPGKKDEAIRSLIASLTSLSASVAMVMLMIVAIDLILGLFMEGPLARECLPYIIGILIITLLIAYVPEISTWALRWLTIAVFMALLVILTANICVRVLGMSISLHWFDEIVELLYVALVFYGAAVWMNHGHFSVGDWISVHYSCMPISAAIMVVYSAKNALLEAAAARRAGAARPG